MRDLYSAHASRITHHGSQRYRFPKTVRTYNTPTLELARPQRQDVIETTSANATIHTRVRQFKNFARRWWIVPLLLIAVMTPLYFLTEELPPTYESRAKMWMTAKLNIAEGRVYNDDLNNFLGTQVELLQSRRLHE